MGKYRKTLVKFIKDLPREWFPGYFCTMNNFSFLTNLLTHRLAARTSGGTDPFIKDFIRHVMVDDPEFQGYKPIEKMRSDLLKNPRSLPAIDFGAGSKVLGKNRTIGQITRVSSINARYGRLLHRLVRYYRPCRIIELGTSTGISTLYLASGFPDALVTTVEGNPLLAELASGNFREAGIKNINVINCAFDEILPELVRDLSGGFMVFIDGNHTGEATLRYYSTFIGQIGLNPILVFDDINWSSEMRMAWNKVIQKIPGGTVVDLFFMGICFADLSSPLQIRKMNY
jgi:predicted O-methyltransferase YrrM